MTRRAPRRVQRPSPAVRDAAHREEASDEAELHRNTVRLRRHARRVSERVRKRRAAEGGGGQAT